MTANDIANMVEKEPYHTNLNRIAIAHFVRQQQAEIEALKKQFDSMAKALNAFGVKELRYEK